MSTVRSSCFQDNGIDRLAALCKYIKCFRICRCFKYLHIFERQNDFYVTTIHTQRFARVTSFLTVIHVAFMEIAAVQANQNAVFDLGFHC